MEITKTVAVDGKEYKVANGTYYTSKTDDRVIEVLEMAKALNYRVRVFYGDTETGKEWLDEYDTMGTISRSTGSIKIPLMIKNSRSYGGAGILTDCIVKITINKRLVYTHPNSKEPGFNIVASGIAEYPYAVTVDGGSHHARFETKEKADNWIKFMKGERNKA